jgi:hypothetical protein
VRAASKAVLARERLQRRYRPARVRMLFVGEGTARPGSAGFSRVVALIYWMSIGSQQRIWTWRWSPKSRAICASKNVRPTVDEQLLKRLHQGQERRDCHSAANYTPYPDAAIFLLRNFRLA